MISHIGWNICVGYTNHIDISVIDDDCLDFSGYQGFFQSDSILFFLRLEVIDARHNGLEPRLWNENMKLNPLGLAQVLCQR